MNGVEVAGPPLKDARLHFDTLFPQPGAAATSVRVRLRLGVDDTGHSCLRDLLRARARLSRMAAGLEVDIERRPGGIGPRGAQCRDLGVRAAEFRMVALADHVAIADDHGAHHRIGRHPTPAALGQLEGPPHKALVDRELALPFVAHRVNRMPRAPSNPPADSSSPRELSIFTSSCHPTSPTMLKNRTM